MTRKINLEGATNMMFATMLDTLLKPGDVISVNYRFLGEDHHLVGIYVKTDFSTDYPQNRMWRIYLTEHEHFSGGERMFLCSVPFTKVDKPREVEVLGEADRE